MTALTSLVGGAVGDRLADAADADAANAAAFSGGTSSAAVGVKIAVGVAIGAAGAPGITPGVLVCAIDSGAADACTGWATGLFGLDFTAGEGVGAAVGAGVAMVAAAGSAGLLGGSIRRVANVLPPASSGSAAPSKWPNCAGEPCSTSAWASTTTATTNAKGRQPGDARKPGELVMRPRSPSHETTGGLRP